jgi:hypothetical protein
MASPKKSKKTSSSLAERKKADLANKILNDRTVTLVLDFVHHHFPEAVPASGLMDGWAREAAGAAINILSYSSGQATGANDLEALYSFLTENHNYLKAGAEVTYEFGHTALGSAQADSPDYRYASLGFKHFGPAWKQSGAGLGTSDHGILDLMSFFRDPKMPPTEGAMAAMDTGGLTAYDRALWYSGGETTSLENFKLVLSGQGAGDVLNKLASYVALDWVLSRVFAAVFIELEIGINNGSSWFGDAYNNSGGRRTWAGIRIVVQAVQHTMPRWALKLEGHPKASSQQCWGPRSACLLRPVLRTPGATRSEAGQLLPALILLPRDFLRWYHNGPRQNLRFYKI